MKKLMILAGLLSLGYTSAIAQTTDKSITEHDPAVRAKDSTIKADVIDPAVHQAGGNAPDWGAIMQIITAKYDAVTADRTVTKSKIYFSYGKDWTTFCMAIVNYTDKYELSNDYKLLNTNAGMILKNSTDPAQLKEAQKWSKAALDSDPNNEKYKSTYDGLTVKTAGN